MSNDRKWVKVTVVDEKTDEEFAWVAADIRHSVSDVHPAKVPTVGLTLTEAQARTLARRILSTLGDIDDENEVSCER